jgi:hypothetical protein
MALDFPDDAIAVESQMFFRIDSPAGCSQGNLCIGAIRMVAQISGRPLSTNCIVEKKG